MTEFFRYEDLTWPEVNEAVEAGGGAQARFTFPLGRPRTQPASP